MQEYIECSIVPRMIEFQYAAAYWQQWQHIGVDIGEGWEETTYGQERKAEGEKG